MTEISFIKRVTKKGNHDLLINVPRELYDLFLGKRVKVMLISNNEGGFHEGKRNSLVTNDSKGKGQGGRGK